MYFLKLNDMATLPSRGTKYSCGYDMFALNSGHVPAGERLLVPTGISWMMENTADGFLKGILSPRSGLSHKHGIQILGGVIDADYEGDIGVILYNSGVEDFTFKAGDAIAQMVIGTTQFVTNDIVEDVVRGDGKFNSTNR